MKKQVVGIILGIALISLVSAMYSGECMEIDLSELDTSEDVLYFIAGNSSNTEGLNISFNDTTKNASVCVVINYKPDSFTLVFFNKEKEVVVKYKSDGGSSDTIYIENKTIKYVDREVPNYIDRIIYKENDTIREDDGLLIDMGDKDIWKYASWKYWYFYTIILGILILLVYLWLRSIYNEGRIEEEEDSVTPI